MFAVCVIWDTNCSIFAVTVSNSGFCRLPWKKGWSLLPETVKKASVTKWGLILQIIADKHDAFQQDLLQHYCLKDQMFLWVTGAVFKLYCSSPIQLKTISPAAACFPVSAVSKAEWVMSVENAAHITECLHIETKGHKHRTCICPDLLLLTAATNTPTSTSRGAANLAQLGKQVLLHQGWRWLHDHSGGASFPLLKSFALSSITFKRKEPLLEAVP